MASSLFDYQRGALDKLRCATRQAARHLPLPPPVVCAAVLCALFIYGGIVRPSNRKPFKCLSNISDIRVLQGTIASNPVRISTGTSYVVRLRPKKAIDIYGREYSCTGEVASFIDKDTVEAYHPSGLFTASRKGGALICESGAMVELNGKFGKGDAFSVKSAKMLGWGRGPLAYVIRVRAISRLRFRSLMAYWGSAGGLLLALLSGIREYTEQDTREAFRLAGLLHILALSGMHLSLVSGIAVAVSKKAGGRRVSYIAEAVLAALFVWFAGFSPSLLRAFMFSYLLLAMSVCGVGKKDLFSVLCAVFLLHAVISPSDVTTAAFMFSYGALAGILTIGEASKSLVSRVVPPFISSPLCASIGAQAAAIPISLCLFGEFMPAGVIAAVAVSPLIVLFICAGIALTALSLIIPPAAVPSGFFLGAVYKAIKLLVMFFARFPSVRVL